LDVVAHTIINEIREHNIHNDDVVILASKISILQEIDHIIRMKSNINTITIFEAKEDKEKYKNDIKSIRKFKKIAFNHHSGKLKISTIHSFKGYEAKTVFLIVDEDNYYEELDDNAEMIYTAITRSKFNIMIFTLENSAYNNFFSKHLQN
jgi:superfamily I DNA/RNA helicase